MSDKSGEKTKENLHSGHRQRLKERFLKNGLDSFEPHNVLELALFFVIHRKDTNEIAHNLINQFGSISGVFEASYEDLKAVNGISDHAACFLKLIPELARKYYSDSMNTITKINSVKSAGEFFMSQLYGREDENFIVASLDNNGRVKSCDFIASGTINEVAINIRSVVETCVKNRAAAVVIAHNHPHGVPMPSEPDVETTWQIRNALDMVKIKLLDHIIVAGNEYTSMRETKKYSNIFLSDDE